MATKKKTKKSRKLKTAGGDQGRMIGYSRDGRRVDAQGQTRRGVIVRKDGRELDRFLVYMPLPLGQRLRVHAAATRQDLSTVVSSAVEVYLEKHAK